MSTYGPQGGPAWPAPPQMAAPPPKKKGISTGCWIALAAVLLFFGSVAGVMIYIGYQVSQNKDVQNVMGTLGDVAGLAIEAQNAPGTAELRALGCEQALALDPAKMQKIAEKFMDQDASLPPLPTPGIGRIVMCQVGAFGTAPKCDDAARAYVRGAAPTASFMLMVQTNKKTTCDGTYSSTGALLSSGTTRPKP